MDEGRVAVVTGASSGIGRAIAVALAPAVGQLCLVGRDESRLADVADEARRRGARVMPFGLDLTSEQRVRELGSEVDQQFRGLDILVHAAGIYSRAELSDATLDALDAQYQANVRAPYQLTQTLLPALVRRQGDVIFLNSTQGLSASGGIGQYAAMQHAMRAIADSLRAEINPAGVRVITLHLGRTASPLQERIHGHEGRAYEPHMLIQPEDVADLVATVVDLPKRTQVTTMTVWTTRKF